MRNRRGLGKRINVDTGTHYAGNLEIVDPFDSLPMTGAEGVNATVLIPAAGARTLWVVDPYDELLTTGSENVVSFTV